MKHSTLPSLALSASALAALALSTGMAAGTNSAAATLRAPMPIVAPTISCAPNPTAGARIMDITICAGATGLPGGFSVQWMTRRDYALGPDGRPGTGDDNSWSPTACSATFSGNVRGSTYGLAANACTTVHIGGGFNPPAGYSVRCDDPLRCDTQYVFRAFGHATSEQQRSDFTRNTSCTTGPCPRVHFTGCTKSQGYFGNLFFNGGPNAGQLNSHGIAVTHALAHVGGSVTVCGATYSSAAEIDAFLPGGGGSPCYQALALALNIAMSDSRAPNACDDGGPYPAGLGDAVICGIAPGSPFTGDTAFTAAMAAALNGRTVREISADANDGSIAGFSNGQLTALLELINVSFDGEGTGGCCGASPFGQNHLFVGACP